MFTLVAALIFAGSGLFAIATIVWMFATHHRKMAAALLFEPIPQEPQVYHIRVRRPRVGLADRPAHGVVLAA